MTISRPYKVIVLIKYHDCKIAGNVKNTVLLTMKMSRKFGAKSSIKKD